MRRVSLSAIFIALLVTVIMAAPAPQLKSVSSTPITVSTADQTFVGTGARLNSPLRVFLREASVSAWTEIPQATSVNQPAGRFTWHWTFEDSGDYYMKLRNPDGKDSSQLKFTVQPNAPPMSIYCAANQTVTSPDGQPFAVTFPMPTTTGGVAPITVTTAPVNGSNFPVGTTTVTGTAVDALGARQTCTFTVTVVVAPPPPTANCDTGVNLNANILLDGADVLEWVGTPSQPCIVNGNNFRVMLDGGGSWTGRFKCSNAIVTGLGTETLHAIGDNSGTRYGYMNGAQLVLENCELHRGGSIEVFTANGASIVIRNSTYAADNLVPAGHDAAENIPWFTDTGSSTAPKVFQGNKVYRSYANFNSPNWTIGAPKGIPCSDTAVNNLFLGPRVGFQLMNAAGSYASCNYVHVDLEVTPQKDYWSQVLAMGWCGAGVELGPNIFRTGHWVLRGVDCIANDVIVVEGSGHAHISLGNGGTVNRPLIFGMYAGCARYSACQYGLPASVETQQESNVLTVNNAMMDLRGPDGAITPFVQGVGTLVHSGETIIRQSSDTRVRGPLSWATSQAGIASAENAGFPFNDEDLLNGTSTLQDWINYLRWVYAPAGSGGTAPRLAQTNQRPAVGIGAPVLDLPVGATEAQLSGYAADDRGPLSVRWTLLSGPNAPTFDDATKSTGMVRSLVSGTYRLRFTASDGVLATSKDLIVNVAGSTPPPTPPQGTNTIWLDAPTLARLKNKAATNDPDWVMIKAQADKYAAMTVAPFAVSGCTSTAICYEWQGGGWYGAALHLGLAYQVTGDAKYATKMRELMTAMAEPAKTGNLQPITTDSGYPSRTIAVAVALGYAWTGNTWSQQLKADVFDSLNKWHDWMRASGFAVDGACCSVGSVAVSNYFGGHVQGFGMAGLATRGANPRGQEIADFWRTKFNLIDQEFTSGVWAGGYPVEGYVYGMNNFFRLVLYAHAIKTATGEDLMFKYGPLMVRNLFYNLKPNRFQFTDESNYSGDYTGLIDKTNLVMLANVAPPPWNAYVNYLWKNMGPVPGDYGPPQPVFSFIFGDPSIPATDYKPASSLVYHSPGDGHVYVRTDWTDNAIWSSFNPCSCHLGGHAMRAAGHIALQRGTDYLLINAGQWKGTTDGIGGTPYAFDLRSKETNGLGYNNPWNADYDGGQGWWGSQTGYLLDYKEDPAYVYARSDETSAYTYIPTGLGFWKRSFVDLRNGTIVVFDSVKAGDPSHLKQLFWHVPPTGPRQISGNTFTSKQGGSKLTVQTLLPANAPLSIQPDYEYDGSSVVVSYRLQVSGANNAVDWTVVTVLQATAAGVTPPTASATVGAQIVVSGIGKTLTFNPDGSLISVN